MEYQFNAMLDKLKNIDLSDKYNTTIPLPHSIVIQLEKSLNVSDYYQVTYVDSSTGNTLEQKFPIIKMWEHTIDELGKNGQYMILPFKLLEHRKENINVDKFIEDMFNIKGQINNLYKKETISERFYEELYEAHHKIAQMVAQKYINKEHLKRKEVEDMFTEIKERPSLVRMRIEEEVAKAVDRAEALKVLKALELGWSEKEIIDVFDISIEQAKQILANEHKEGI